MANAVSYSINNRVVRDTFYIDKNSSPSLQSEKYFVKSLDTCGNGSAISKVAQTIFLKAENNDFHNIAVVQFTPYETWKQGVTYYEIDYFNTVTNAWELLKINTFNTFNTSVTALPDFGYNRITNSQTCYRIKAVEQNGNKQISMSNEACVAVYPVVFIPNSFSPNGDGLNDYFKPVASGLNGYIFEVYNRWGALVYSDTPESKGWDGTIDGEKAEVGTYVYRLSAAGFLVSPYTNAARRVEYKGTVELVR